MRVTEAKRLVPVACRTMALQSIRRGRETPAPTIHCGSALEFSTSGLPEGCCFHLKSLGEVNSLSDSGFLICKVENIKINRPEWF